MLNKVSYCSWEGDPAILAYYDDGRILGFAYLGDTWREANSADIATKAPNIGEAHFRDRWPDLELPDLQ